MEHIIIGTAGHIDHGKTALIRALTGRETDTLKEEKKRGISIDLGFTYFDLPGGSRAGIIDVPGHEKFLSNMMAGVCGMDLVLLVIALDEGVMPQTREHMEILKYLGVKQGIIVLTKSDLVEVEWADMMEEEIRQELEGSIYEGWKWIRVSSATGEGIEPLKVEMTQIVGAMSRTRNTEGRFRLPIDRVMSLKGLGTVVAGTLLEGSLHVGAEVMLYPSEQLSYIKSIQVHGQAEESAYAGQRTAILLSNVKKEEVRRGYTVAYPESLRMAERLDVVIEMESDTERILKNQSRLHLYIGTSEVLCRAVLLEKNELKKGESAYAQLVLEEPLAVKKGDRFVLRFYSPLEIIGGGKVLDECAVKHKRYDDAILTYLKNKEEDKDEAVILSTIETTEKPYDFVELERETKIGTEALERHMEELAREQNVAVIPGRKKTFYWSFVTEEKKWEQTEQYLKEYHKEHPYRYGVDKATLRSHGFGQWEMDRWDAYLVFCKKEHQLVVGNDGNSYYLAETEPQMDDTLIHLLDEVKQEFQAAGVDFVDVSRIVEEQGKRISKKKGKGTQAQKIKGEDIADALVFLAKQGELACISEQFYTTNEIADDIKQKVVAYFETNEILSFASLRDLLSTSRRSAKPIMAYLDTQKITVWCGKETERKQYINNAMDNNSQQT